METIELYTRPGCPYCFRLRRRLRKHGIEFREVNIWKDVRARDRVRAVGRGNETVPTVRIGDRWLINPTVEDVTTELSRVANANCSTAIGVTVERRDGPVVTTEQVSTPRRRQPFGG